uniref:Uncharacterized protein n=1 Tax=Anguilla anguilla TaxID=7936 RepID=A0A0E9WQG3_ANGAN
MFIVLVDCCESLSRNLCVCQHKGDSPSHVFLLNLTYVSHCLLASISFMTFSFFQCNFHFSILTECH